jgi:5-methylcytosine-specific restriction endonuclease McrA
MASGQWEGSTRRATLGPEFFRNRNRVLKRDGRVCQLRDAMCIGLATEVDHIGNREDHSEINLRAACKPCHQNRSSSQGGVAAGRARQAQIAARKRKPESHPGLISP